MANEQREPREPFLSNRRVFGLTMVAAFLVLLVLFAADNFVLIEVRLFTVRIQMRLAWALLIPLVGGSVAGFIAGRFWR